jgi:hypothetical protein
MPVELEKKQKDKLLKGITLNGLGSLLFIAIIFGYILPTYDSIDQKKNAAITAQSEFQTLETQGVTATEYVRIAGIKQKGSLSKPEVAEITAALKKTGKQDTYLDWVNEELARKSEFDAEIEKNNQIVTDIMPTYSDILLGTNDDFDKNRMTLGDLTRFIEEDLLIAHNLESTSPIGFGSITFNAANNPVSNIWTYTLNLDIIGKNKNLKSLISMIQSSGVLVIKDGKIQSPTISTGEKNAGEKKFSNLLISIKSATFPALFDANPEKETTLNLSLQMYVRAQNLSDLIGLKEQLVQRADTLKKNIELYSTKCDTPGAQHCTKESYYRAVQTLKVNFKEVSDVTKKIVDSKKVAVNATMNLQAEFDSVIKLYTDFSAAEGLVSRAISTIDTTIKSDTQTKN